MRIELKNINKIKCANIELNSLTVIAGANDSGKSTVGKILFSAIKALISGLNDSEEQKEQTIKERATSLVRRLDALQMSEDKIKQYRQLFPLPSSLFGFSHQLEQNPDKELFFTEREKWINSLDIIPRQKMLALKDLHAIQSLYLEKADYSTRMKAEFQSYIESEFLNNICSYKTDRSSIKYISDNNIFDVELKSNEVTEVTCKAHLDTILNDVTYVESPLYVHLLDTLAKTTTYREIEKNQGLRSLFDIPMIPTHIKDIATKLEYSHKYFHPKNHHDLFNSDSLQNIKSITGGHFTYDKNTRSLLWVKGDQTFSPINVASGIKSFGIIQLLLEANMIDANKMLIWDEPENHLHPKWQIEFAHLLVNLAKAGIPVVVSSHSPYFIQGIRYFSQKEKIDKFVNYYLAEDTEDNLAELNEVTNDLNQIFVKLAEPLNEIMNLQ